MKRLVLSILLLFLLLLPTQALAEDTGYLVRVGSGQSVFAITAVYEVDASKLDASTVNVTSLMPSEVLYETNFDEGTAKLYLSCASAKAIDTSIALFRIDATPTGDFTLTDALTLNTLKINGKSAISNLFLDNLIVQKQDNGLHIAATLADNLGEAVFYFISVAYDSKGKMLCCDIISSKISEGSVLIETTLTSNTTIASVKLIILNSTNLAPLLLAIEAEI